MLEDIITIVNASTNTDTNTPQMSCNAIAARTSSESFGKIAVTRLKADISAATMRTVYAARWAGRSSSLFFLRAIAVEARLYTAKAKSVTILRQTTTIKP